MGLRHRPVLEYNNSIVRDRRSCNCSTHRSAKGPKYGGNKFDYVQVSAAPHSNDFQASITFSAAGLYLLLLMFRLVLRKRVARVIPLRTLPVKSLPSHRPWYRGSNSPGDAGLQLRNGRQISRPQVGCLMQPCERLPVLGYSHFTWLITSAVPFSEIDRRRMIYGFINPDTGLVLTCAPCQKLCS